MRIFKIIKKYQMLLLMNKKKLMKSKNQNQELEEFQKKKHVGFEVKNLKNKIDKKI